ncbi:tetratricopeptide repeat protein [Bacillus alkalisoli]|uniref:tetratricopeptide repeat protein n=1 Tax=Bacillus alkalisoli TaxID=2011008 RepID=UPI000C24CFF0|nr:tetratricopeptide repeat protein [Bacillus alkalisoli]
MGNQTNINQIAKVIPFEQNGEYYFQKGLRAYRKRDLYKARKWFQRAATLQPSDANVVSQYAIVLMELGDYQASNDLFYKIIHQLNDEMYDCHYFLANNYAYLGLFQEAKKHAEEYLTMEPDGEFADDAEDLLDLLELDEDDEEEELTFSQDQLIVMQEKSRDLLEAGELEEALDLLHEIIEEYPNFWSAYNNLALAYFYKGDLTSAKKILFDVLEKNPGNLHALCNLVVFYYYENNEEGTNQLADRLVNVTPMLIEHRYKLGATFGLIGRHELAYKWLRSIHRNGFHGDGTFHYWLSHAAYHTNNGKVAKQAWERVMELNPEKAGSEPWATDENPIASNVVAEQLFKIFMSSLSSKTTVKEVLQQPWKTPFVKDFALYALLNKKDVHGTVSSLYEVAKKIFEENNDEMVQGWFRFYELLKENNMSLENIRSWAAAFEYSLLKSNGVKVTQQTIATKYELSISTLRSYLKLIKDKNLLPS